MKSPLLRAFFTPHVHQRLRKRPPRCTLDCGFKTSESPALRGFVGGLRALATAALYLVLKSNGLHRSKNLPVKFGFSPRTVPANIAKKLPSQCWPKPIFIALFNFSHKWPTFAFTGESGHTLAFRRKIAHNGTHAETRAIRMGMVSLPSARFACSRNAGRSLIKTTCLPFSEVDGHCSLRDAYFLANIQVSLSVISVANVFALWYDKSHKSGLSEMRVSQNNRKGKNAEQMLHDANDAKELSDDWDRAKDLCYDYNQLRPSKELFAL